ncbi:MAG: DUF1971 domain-containing protein [Alphaproteobacteria bacterium]|nr:DUF1971 domain-containing protein [Alphaproteobacteria bacterium]
MKTLPPTVKPYKRTPVFTQETVPQGLLRDHNTKAGTWGVIHVQKGELAYIIGDSQPHILKPGKNGIVEPQILHHIKPLGDVSFFVEFYK